MSTTPVVPLNVSAKTYRVLRFVMWVVLWIVLALILLGLAASYYTTTDDFQKRVGSEVVSVLEDSTGGKVEVGHISFSLWHLAIEADGLVIHGTEAAGQAPYISAAKIFLRLKINTFLSHTVGRGAQSHVGLNFLRVEQPHVHLIVDKDGKTNQPVPKHPGTSTEPVQSTLLDLQAGKVELADGLVLINDKAIPFDVAAKQLNVEVHYISSSDRYGATIDLADLRTKIAAQPEVQSKLHLTAQLGRDMASLDSFEFDTANNTKLTASGELDHFDKPTWQGKADGGIDLKQVGLLAGVDGLTAGRLDLALAGHSCTVTPQVAQQHPHFWQRHKKTPPEAKVLPPDPACSSGYLFMGNLKLHDAGYRNEYVRLHDINGGAQLHVTPTELLFTTLTGYLPGGGSASGELKIENWLGEVPVDSTPAGATVVAATKTANTAAKDVGAASPVKPVNSTPPVATQVQRAHAYLTVTVDHIALRTIMDITAPEHYGDLGFDTAITGPVKVEWGGPANTIADSVRVDANLQLAPTGTTRKGALNNLPVNGQLLAHYDGGSEVVKIQSIDLRTPQTTLSGNGVLGVSSGDPLTSLNLDLQARDLGEFDQLLQTLGFEANGKKGSAAIPVVLHGTLGFMGTARGAIANLDVKGHLNADNLAVHLGSTADVHIDSVVADAEYSPNGGVSVASSTIKRGTAVLNLTGAFKPHRLVSRRGVVSYAWDEQLGIDAGVKLADAQLADVLEIAGQKDKIPATGTLNVNGHVSGAANNLSGTGNVTLLNGMAYGEAFQKVAMDVTAAGQQINASNILLMAHDMSVTGSGGYNLTSKRITAQLAGNNLQLGKFDTLAKSGAGVDGALTFNLNVNGTAEQPDLHANLKLANASVQGKALGELTATANSSGSNVTYELHSNAVGAQIVANGTTSLLGDNETQAKLTIANVDIANAIALFAPGTIKGSSNLAATINVHGPAAKPQQLAGDAEFTSFDVKLEGVELKSAEPLRASLRNGIVTLDAVHITGQDTDLRAGGTAQVFGDSNVQGGALHLTTEGSISMALVHTFDPDLITSGKVTFKVAAEGRVKKPSLTGNVLFQNVNVAVDGIPNGLSNMNGTLAFNEDRLDVKDLTARTGGGQLTIGGSLTYQKGIFADLTATADTVRIRYAGLSSTANAKFRLQGGPQSVLLSGNVLITRFGVGADVDFAAFGGPGISPPPDPNAATNKIRLDVHITSAPQLDFQNSFAKLAGTVDLNVRGTVAQPSVLGRIQITDGSATFAGTNYQLQRGTITFANPVRIDPIVDLDATARVENYDITIGVHGTTTSLKPTYRSEPPLTEADIFNLLALGRTQEEAQLNTEQQVQAGTDPTTSSLLGGALNATVGNRVGKLFGAGSVKIDPSFVGTLGTSSARITIQEPLSKQLTLVFATSLNQSTEQLIQLQYQIDENKSLVATRDESGVFSIVYKLRKRYR